MKIAVICNPCVNRDGLGDFLFRPLSKLVEAVKFHTGDETEGFDHYYYIDDGPSSYDEPKFHPATYFALDFVVPNVWFTNHPSIYIHRMKNFDVNYVFTSDTLKFCEENGINAKLTTFGADPEHHKPYPEEKVYDWSAVWHNWGDRANAVEAVMKVFPNGHVGWHGTGENWEYNDIMNVSRSICQSKCTLNWFRANMVNMRVYESMAAGVPLISTRHKDMPLFGFRDGKHYLAYTGVTEMIENIRWVLDNPTKAQRMAKIAREYVLREHTYERRAREILGYN